MVLRRKGEERFSAAVPWRKSLASVRVLTPLRASRPAVSGERDNFSINSAGASRALFLITHLLFSLIFSRFFHPSTHPVKKVFLSGHLLHLWLSAFKRVFLPGIGKKKEQAIFLRSGLFLSGF